MDALTKVHAPKRLVTQNIDGSVGKAWNAAYVPIHGRLDKVTVLLEQGLDVPLIDAPWEDVAAACDDLDDNARLAPILLDVFKISKKTLAPEPDVSLKPFVLLFDNTTPIYITCQRRRTGCTTPRAWYSSERRSA